MAHSFQISSQLSCMISMNTVDSEATLFSRENVSGFSRTRVDKWNKAPNLLSYGPGCSILIYRVHTGLKST